MQPVEQRYRLKEEKDDTSFDRSHSDPKEEAGYASLAAAAHARAQPPCRFRRKITVQCARAGGRVEGGRERKTAELMRDDQGGGVAFPPVGFDRGCARRERAGCCVGRLDRTNFPLKPTAAALVYSSGGLTFQPKWISNTPWKP